MNGLNQEENWRFMDLLTSKIQPGSFLQSKSAEIPTQNDDLNIKHVALAIKHGHFTIHYLNHQN